MKTIIDRIDQSYSTLTSGQQKIATYLYDNLQHALLLDSVQIAKKCGVSETTVSRFIRNLGYSGISEFKREIGKIVLKDYSSPSKLSDSKNNLKDSDSILNKILAGDADNLNTLLASISPRTFENAVNKICSAKSLHVVGLRSNYALAFYVNFHLRYFLDSVKLLKPGCGDVPDQIYRWGTGDVLLIISFKRHPRLAIKVAERAKSKGVYIIAITNHNLSPIGQISDLCLVTKTEVPSYIESPTASLCLLNALITAVAMKKKDKSISSLNSLEAELNEFETYRKEFRHKLLS